MDVDASTTGSENIMRMVHLNKIRDLYRATKWTVYYIDMNDDLHITSKFVKGFSAFILGTKRRSKKRKPGGGVSLGKT